MRRKKLVLVIFMLFVTVLSVSGCSMTNSDNKPLVQPGSYVIDESVNKQVVDLVKNYYTTLYTGGIDSYQDASVNGNISAGITKYVSKQTLKDAVNNPEMGIHYPRFVELNGITAVSYEVLKNSDVPEISADYIGKNGNAMLYYTKVNLKAKCVPENVFNDSYSRNPDTGAYVSKKPIDLAHKL